MIPVNMKDTFHHPTKNLDLLVYLLYRFSNINFAVVMMKERNFLHVVDLSFDVRFAKYYQFSLGYHKQFLINNIKVKYLQIGQLLI